MANKIGYASSDELRAIAEDFWKDLVGFGSYAFPKAHSTSYSLIANATQWLKIHYPLEFFCAFLEQAVEDEYNMVKHISKTKYKIDYIMPDINLSKTKFSIHDNKIVWSLSSVKGIGEKAAYEIEKCQPFKSFEDFYERINKRVINVRVVKVLITANSFRVFGSRNEIVEKYYSLHGGERRDDLAKKSDKEWDMAASGIMAYFRQTIQELFPSKTKNTMSYDEFIATKYGKRVIVAGFIGNFRIIETKRGTMALMKLVNGNETFNIVIWSD